MNILIVLLLVVAFGTAAFFAVVASRVRREQSRQLSRQKLLMEMTRQALSSDADEPGFMDRLMKTALSGLAEVFKAESVGYFEPIADSESYLLRSGSGWHKGYVGQRIRGGYPLSLHQSVIVKKLRTETPSSEQPIFGNHDLVSGMSVAIPSKDPVDEHGVLGILGLFTHSSRDFSSEDLDYVSTIGQVLGIQMQRGRLLGRIESQEQIIAALNEKLPLAWLAVDGESKVRFWSTALEQLTGRPGSEAIGKTLHDLMIEPGSGELRRADGSTIPIQAESSRVAMGSSPRSDSSGFLFSFQDLRERKFLEKERGKTLRERERLLNAVSRNLKTPLTVIELNADVLKKLLAGSEDQKLKRSLKNVDLILVSVERMGQLIQNLMDLSRIQSGEIQMNREPRTAESLVHEVAQTLHPVAQSRSIWLRSESTAGDAVIECDHDRMLQALMNLAANALKVTPEGGSIYIKAEPSGRTVRFTVRDTGPGIPGAQLAGIFDQFWLASDESMAKRQGPGLGLPLTKAIVEAHGGTLSVESEAGGGSTFYIQLPQAEAPAETRSEVEVAPLTTQIEMREDAEAGPEKKSEQG